MQEMCNVQKCYRKLVISRNLGQQGLIQATGYFVKFRCMRVHRESCTEISHEREASKGLYRKLGYFMRLRPRRVHTGNWLFCQI